MNVTKLELCSRVAGKLNKQATDMKPIFETFLDEIFEVLSEGRRIEIRGFGCFLTKTRRKRIGRNPRTGETVDIPAYTAPVFKFSKDGQKNFDIKLKKSKKVIKKLDPDSLESIEKPPLKPFKPAPVRGIKTSAENFSPL